MYEHSIGPTVKMPSTIGSAKRRASENRMEMKRWAGERTGQRGFILRVNSLNADDL